MATPYRKAFALAFLVFVAAHAFLMAAPRLYPFTDLPNHLAAATILRESGQPSNEFDEYFTLSAFPVANTAHLRFCASQAFPSVEAANRFLYAAYALLLPLSVLLIIRRLGGNEWYAMLSFLFVPNYSVSWGFAGFTLATPMVLFFVLLLLVHDGRPSAGTGWGLAALLLLLFAMHVLAALFSLLVYIVWLVWRHRSAPASLFRESIPALPLLLLLATWWATRGAGGDQALIPYLLTYYLSEYLPSLRSRGMLLFIDGYHLLPGIRGYAIAALFSMAAVVPVTARLPTHLKQLRSFYLERRRAPLYALAVASFLACLLLPEGIPGQWSLWMRYTVFALLSLIVLASTLQWRRFATARAAVICLLCLVHVVVWSDYLAGFQRDSRSFDATLLPEAVPGSILSGLILDPQYRGTPVYMHFQNYYIVWKRGIATTGVVDYRFGTVRRAVGENLLPENGASDAPDGVPGRKYELADHVLARGEIGDGLLERLDDFRPAVTRGRWTLLTRERSIESASPVAGDGRAQLATDTQ